MHTTTSLHHIEVHTLQPDPILDLFTRVYGFQLIAQRRTWSYRQWFCQSAHCRLIISSVVSDSNFGQRVAPEHDQHYDILTSILTASETRKFVLNRETVFNVALEVKSVRTMLDRHPDLEVS